MKFRRFNTLFLRIFSLLTILSIILIFIYNYFFSNYAQSFLRKNMYVSNLNMLSKTSDYISSIFKNTTNIADQLASDNLIMSMALIPDNNNRQLIDNIIQNLKHYKESNKLIASIYLYLPYNNMIISSDEGVCSARDYYDYPYIEAYNKSPYTQKIFSLKEFPQLDGTRTLYITYAKNFPRGYNGRMGQIVINLSCKELFDEIKVYGGGDLNEQLTILSDDGIVLLSENPEYIGKLYTEKGLSNMLDNRQGYFSVKKSNITYMDFFVTSKILHWKYVFEVEQQKFLGINKTTTNLFIYVALLCLLISIFPAYILSRKIYKPIKSLVNKIEDYGKLEMPDHYSNEYDYIWSTYQNTYGQFKNMEYTLEQIKPIVREQYIQNLLLGQNLSTEETTQAIISYAFPNWNSSDDYIIVLAIQIDMPVDSIGLYSYALKNCIYDFLKNDFNIDCITIDFLRIAIILKFDKDKNSEMKILNNCVTLVNQLEELIKNTFNLTFTYGTGGIYSGIANLRQSYQDALKVLKYNLYLGRNLPAPETEKPAECTSNGYQKEILLAYYKEKENKLFELIALPNMEDSMILIEEIFNQFRATPQLEERFIKSMSNHIIDGLSEIAISLGIRAEEFFESSDDVYHNMADITGIDDLEIYIKGLCIYAVNRIDTFKSKRQYKYVNKIVDFINENYSNSDLDLNAISDYIGINPSYVSRLFKENIGQNYLDFLNSVRIEKSKQLLVSTKLTIKDIGFKVGFNTIQNFIRTFKKYEQIPPGQYRDKHTV